MSGKTEEGSAVQDSCWDFRDSVWEILTNKERVRSYQIGVAPFTQTLNSIMLRMSQNLNVENIGDLKIYRISSLRHLLSSAVKGKLRLASPTSWEDTWEDSLWRTVEKVGIPHTNKYRCFAQCWSTNPACEGIWARFKNAGRSIRIETTIKGLLSSIKIPENEYTGSIDEQVFISKVCYLDDNSKEEFRQEIVNQIEQKSADFDLVRAASLYAKRLPFEYEKEVRFMFRQKNDSNNSKDYFEFDWEPRRMITSLQLDPWCSEEEYDFLSKLLHLFGFACSQSDLCKPLVSLNQGQN